MDQNSTSEKNQTVRYIEFGPYLEQALSPLSPRYDEKSSRVGSYNNSHSARNGIVIIFGIIAIIVAIVGGVYEYKRRRRLDRMASQLSQFLATQVTNKTTNKREVVLVPVPQAPPPYQSSDQTTTRVNETNQDIAQTSTPPPTYTHEQNLSFQNYSRQYPSNPQPGLQLPPCDINDNSKNNL